MQGNTKKGLLFALAAAGISGVAIFYNKLIVVSGIDPVIFNILKNGGVAIALTFMLIATRKIFFLTTLKPKTWVKLWLIAAVGGSIPFVLFFDALRFVPATSANIIQKSLFLWVALLAIPILHERLTPVQVAGYIIVAASNLFLGGFTGFSGSGAEFMILTATILWAAENIVAKMTLKEVPSQHVAWARMFFGTILLFVYAAWQGKTHLMVSAEPAQYWAILGSVIILTVYVSCWYQALKLAPATLVTSVLILATPLTNVLSAVFITHKLPAFQILNLFGTVLGLILISRLLKPLQTKPAQS